MRDKKIQHFRNWLNSLPASKWLNMLCWAHFNTLLLSNWSSAVLASYARGLGFNPRIFQNFILKIGNKNSICQITSYLIKITLVTNTNDNDDYTTAVQCAVILTSFQSFTQATEDSVRTWNQWRAKGWLLCEFMKQIQNGKSNQDLLMVLEVISTGPK